MGLLNWSHDWDAYLITGRNWIDGADGMMNNGEYLLWLLSELPKREFTYTLGWRFEPMGNLTAKHMARLQKLQVSGEWGEWEAYADSPIIALVDAAIAAMEAK